MVETTQSTPSRGVLHNVWRCVPCKSRDGRRPVWIQPGSHCGPCRASITMHLAVCGRVRPGTERSQHACAHLATQEVRTSRQGDADASGLPQLSQPWLCSVRSMAGRHQPSVSGKHGCVQPHIETDTQKSLAGSARLQQHRRRATEQARLAHTRRGEACVLCVCARACVCSHSEYVPIVCGGPQCGYCHRHRRSAQLVRPAHRKAHRLH